MVPHFVNCCERSKSPNTRLTAAPFAERTRWSALALGSGHAGLARRLWREVLTLCLRHRQWQSGVPLDVCERCKPRAPKPMGIYIKANVIRQTLLSSDLIVLDMQINSSKSVAFLVTIMAMATCCLFSLWIVGRLGRQGSPLEQMQGNIINVWLKQLVFFFCSWYHYFCVLCSHFRAI